jgi:RNA polymerase sigma-54 factor
MKQTLQIRLGQHLTMTPQLQQAIRLLQLSTMDLREEIQEAIDSNLMLELSEDGGSGEEGDIGDGEGGTVTNGELDAGSLGGDPGPEALLNGGYDVDDSAVELQEAVARTEMSSPDELPVDSVWEDIYDAPMLPLGHAADPEGFEFDNQDRSTETLHDHLEWQLQMSHFSDRDYVIAMSIIDWIDDRGYLGTSLEEIREGLAREIEDLEIEEVETVLRRIQHFDPVGVGARDLRECILIQLHYCDPATPSLAQAKELVDSHLELLGRREYPLLMRKLKCSREDLLQIISLVQAVNPSPGNLITDRKVEYIIPDVIVRREKDAWKVELNPEAVPRVRINAGYSRLVKRADNSADNAYMRNQLQEARWFVKSLQSRNDTLLKVATCIVERQRGFLEHGEEAMKALVLHDVAKAVDMHESTISRVTTQKFMHTPRGIFELKYFFSSHVSTDSGGECSATAIRALIRKFVAAEDGSKPLSDSKIAQLLKQQGINVARRTIAKYRESLSIPSSSERKRLV